LNGLFVVYTVEWERGYRQGGLVVRRLVRAKGGGGTERGEMRGGKREWREEGGERRGERERERLLLLYIHCLQCVCLVAIHHT